LPPRGSIAVSSATGNGLGALVGAITGAAGDLLPAEGQLALNRRQAECLVDAYAALQHSHPSPDLAVVAEGLRSARLAFDRLAGRAGVEDVLDSLFGRFCLGK
jgi:tRNA modification GTPase